SSKKKKDNFCLKTSALNPLRASLLAHGFEGQLTRQAASRSIYSLKGKQLLAENRRTQFALPSFLRIALVSAMSLLRPFGANAQNSYDRSLSPPASDCSKIGTAVVFDSSIDKNRDAVDGGGGIDENKLPRNPNNHCAPVFPHNFIRVNTIFEVIKESGRRTAWSDKH